MPELHKDALSSITARWNTVEETVELVVDGTPVPAIVNKKRNVGISPFAHRFPQSSVDEWLAGYRDPELRGATTELTPGELELTVCPYDADILCGTFAVWLARTDDRIIWHGPHWAGDAIAAEILGREDLVIPEGNDDPLTWFPPKLEFPAAEYDAAMDSVQHIIEAHPWPASPSRPPSRLTRMMIRLQGDRDSS
ncbi:hypothetical protein Q2T94_07495 [Paeniglutamicibacter sulfureus]|uniref:hypothetical protein n=1 Tax=Paeniglutamicibacter sulfureus TaxID=43666 RepID=UPI0026652C24|nr:hypothetical protein [Paeniglutamicibacter sulfureus]MDO2934139.1 hypothetical protein [Paeniglutamicibacter sulfureus]